MSIGLNDSKSFGNWLLLFGFRAKLLQMARAAASHFVPRSSHANCNGSSRSEAKSTLAQISVKNLTVTYSGLRSLNDVDAPNFRTTITSQAEKRGCKTAMNKPSSAIICSGGMNMVFVGTEVAPWSKTGGLGDVLGGLPPAMAVNMSTNLTIFVFPLTAFLRMTLISLFGYCLGQWTPCYDHLSTL